MLLSPILFAIAAAEQDAALMARLQSREPQALAELYDRYGRKVYSLILRAVRDPVAAEDLVQETFLRVWNRARVFDAQRGGIGPWLLAVARNRAIDYLRSAAGRDRSTVEFEETDHPSLYTGVESGILAAEKIRAVRAALDKLSLEQRRVIELAYFEGLSQSEMALHLGQPLGTVKTWVRAALKALREELGATVVPA